MNDNLARFCAKCGAGMERLEMVRPPVSPAIPSAPPPSMALTLQFTYVAVDKTQKQITGTIFAADKHGAILAVEGLGLVPVSVVPASAPAPTTPISAALPALHTPTSAASHPEIQTPSKGSSLRFQCPSCLQKLEAEPEMSGDRIVCPKCGKRFNVPSPQQAGDAHVVVPLGDPAPQAGAAAARRRWKRLSISLALVTLLLVIGVSAFVLPKFLPGAVKKPPLGWVGTDHSWTGSTIYLPREWKFVTAEEARHKYAMEYDPKEMVHFINENHFHQQIEVTFFGWRQSDALGAKGVRGFLTDNMPKKAELEAEHREILSQVIHRVAGGTAAETVMEGQDGVKSRLVILVAKNNVGAKQVVTLSCMADKNDFDEIDTQVFRPMIESFVYGVSRHKEK